MQIVHGKRTIAVAEFTIRDLEYALRLKKAVSSAYPYAHHTKKGPGRKHQQTPHLSKEERHAQ